MLGKLYHSYIHSRMLEIFRHFQPDIAASYDHPVPRLALINKLLYFKRIGYIAQSKYPICLNALNIRLDRPRSG